MKNFHKLGLLLSAQLLLCPLTVSAEEASDTLYYQNKTVSGTAYVQSASPIVSKNVTVSSTGQLNISSLSCVAIGQTFTVQLGGVLNIRTGQPQRIRYTYDACGNRTTRETINE